MAAIIVWISGCNIHRRAESQIKDFESSAEKLIHFDMPFVPARPTPKIMQAAFPVRSGLLRNRIAFFSHR